MLAAYSSFITSNSAGVGILGWMRQYSTRVFCKPFKWMVLYQKMYSNVSHHFGRNLDSFAISKLGIATPVWIHLPDHEVL